MEITSSIFRTIKTIIGLRQYGQKDPLSEFKKRHLFYLRFIIKNKK